MGTTVGQLKRGDKFIFGNVKFEVVIPHTQTDDELALCRIVDQPANVYISNCAWVTKLTFLDQSIDLIKGLANRSFSKDRLS
jgi:hypothetical protein